MKSNFISACENLSSADKMNLFIMQELINNCPIVEKIPHDNDHQLVTFIYHGIDMESVSLYSPLIGIFPIKMFRLGSSNYFYYSLVVPVNIRATYAFTINDLTDYDNIKSNELINVAFIKMWTKLIPDQNNPNKIILKTGKPRVTINISILEMPFAPLQKWSKKRNEVKNGDLIKSEISSSLLASKRDYRVYLPPSYTANNIYPLLMVFDGQFYYESGISLPTILDNLIYEKKIPSIIAVLIDSIGFDIRKRDFRSEEFFGFITDELLPDVQSHYSISRDYRDKILMGASLSGFFALYASLKRPDLFGTVLSQSDGDDIILSLINKTQTPLKIYLDIGSIENYESIKKISELLSSAGHDVIFRIIPGAHDLVSWETAIPDALIELLKK